MLKKQFFKILVFLIFFISMKHSVECTKRSDKRNEGNSKMNQNDRQGDNIIFNYLSCIFNEYLSRIDKYYSGFKILFNDLNQSMHMSKEESLQNLNLENSFTQRDFSEIENFSLNDKKFELNSHTKIRSLQNSETQTGSGILNNSTENIIRNQTSTNDEQDEKNICHIGKKLKSNITSFTCDSGSESKNQDIYYIIGNTSQRDDYNLNFKTSNCTNKTEELTFCICPKTNTRCKTLTNDVICKFNILYADEMNLLSLKDTFYYEYLNSQQLEYQNKPITYRAKLKCRDRTRLPEDNFIFMDNFVNGFNSSEILIDNNLNISDKIFDYYLSDDNITLLQQPELKIKFKIYDMNSLLPKIILDYKIDEEEISEILKGKKEFNFMVELNDEMGYQNLIVGNRLYYEINLIDSKFNSIKYVYFQGALDFNRNITSYYLLSESDGVVMIMLLIFLICSIFIMFIIYRFLRKKRKRNSKTIEEISDKEDNPVHVLKNE